MKKINNKGMTLMELIVSVALISIIMLFMYKLISDVRIEKRENDKVSDIILKISEIEVDSINEIISDLTYEKGEIDTIKLWNDIRYTDAVNGKKYANLQYIRLDIKKADGTMNEYAIGIKDNADQFEIQIATPNANSYNILKKWTLSKEIKDISINEYCLHKNGNLTCQIDLNLLDSNNNNVYTISYPLYFYTPNFKTDKHKIGNEDIYFVKHCNDENCINCTKDSEDSGMQQTDYYSYKRVYKEELNPDEPNGSYKDTHFKSICKI